MSNLQQGQVGELTTDDGEITDHELDAVSGGSMAAGAAKGNAQGTTDGSNRLSMVIRPPML